jgi:hypothetical protein
VAQDVPIAISVISGAQAEETGAFNVNRLKELVPSVQLYTSNPRNTGINIRGLGSPFGLTNDGLDPGVGFYVDGVYFARPAAATLDFIDIEQIAAKLSNVIESNIQINNKISNFLCLVVNILDIWDMNKGNKDWYKYLPTEFTDLQKQQIGDFFIKIEPLLISFRKQYKKVKGGSFPIRIVDSGSDSISDSISDNSDSKQQVSELIELVGTTSFLKQIETYLLSQQIPEEISSENTFSEISFLLSSFHTMDDKLMSLIGPSQFTSNTAVTTTATTSNSKIILLVNTITDMYEEYTNRFSLS